MVKSYVFGLDLGVRSIGWSVVEIDQKGKPVDLIDLGSRIFEAGVEGDVEQGKDSSRAADRRGNRLARRQTWRRQYRISKLYKILQGYDLLPEGFENGEDHRHDVLLGLDARLRDSLIDGEDHRLQQVMPYVLRAKALDEKLERHAFGRALYHLGQRRGYLSNRKTPEKNDDEKGKVKQGIGELGREIEAAGARTLGEYFSKCEPEKVRIRERYTARQMFIDEFNQIWDAQAGEHGLDEDARKVIYDAIFFQRPLKSQSHLIGKCSLTGRRRAPLALPISQAFRMLQKVNDLTMISGEGRELRLDDEQRQKLVEALTVKGDMTFAQIRKLLGLKRTWKFNFEIGGEKKLVGDRTTSSLLEIFGDNWGNMNEAEREKVVEEIVSFQKPEALKQRAQEAWGLDADLAQTLSEVQLEDDHVRLSKVALRKIVPDLIKGVAYSSARKSHYPESFQASQDGETLAPVKDAIEDLNNPAVIRALTELRKVVNALVREYGKPAFFHIELARELKRPRKARQNITKTNRGREKLREDAKKRIFAETGVSYPSRVDIEKVLLADECGWRCPYTGKAITMPTLVGEHPQFDVEHIIPYSRCLDNTMRNKTLCYHDENRHKKRGNTPYDAYSSNEAKYAEIIERVSHFVGDWKQMAEKRKRFEMTPEDVVLAYDDFGERQLRDTSYISRLAADYVGGLYGGRVDAEGKTRVKVFPGMLTGLLRNHWQLNAVLGGAKKNRSDHRHHAVDALIVALTNMSVVKHVADRAEEAEERHTYRLPTLEEPWVNFVDSVREKVDEIVVSHRVDKKISGGLHAESLYSKGLPDGNGKMERRIRKRLDALSSTEIQRIVDPKVRKIVLAKWESLGKGDPKKVFGEVENHPVMNAKDGREIPIHKVRIRSKSQNTIEIGEGARLRHVALNSNHHSVIYADAKSGKWKDEIVSTYEAYERKRRGEPVVQKCEGFVFSLSPSECIEMDNEEGERVLYRVVSISRRDISLRPLSDARTQKEIKEAKDWQKFRMQNMDQFRQRGAVKVSISPTGRVFRMKHGSI